MASIYGITNAFGLNFVKSSPFLSTYAVIVIVLLGLSVVLSLLSFVPSLTLVPSRAVLDMIITSEKYSYFTIAVWITVSAYITPVIAGIRAVYWYRRRKSRLRLR